MLNPCLVMASGMAGAGKTTLFQALATCIVNGVYLPRDPIMWAMMYVKLGRLPNLKSFRAYVGSDVKPGEVAEESTFCGTLLKINERREFFLRHVDDQSYLVLDRLAKIHLGHGKVPLLDSCLWYQIKGNVLQAFFAQKEYAGFARRLIHVVADPEVCYERHLARTKTHNAEERSAREPLSASRDSFMREMREKYRRTPPGLEKFRHLVVDTTCRPIEECLEQCLEYISS